MPRAKFKPKTRKKKWMKLVKGYVGGRGRLYRVAKNAAMKALMYSYIHRRQKKRDMRRLQIVKINAACRQYGITYSQFIHKLKEKGMGLIVKCWQNWLNINRMRFVHWWKKS